MLPVCCRLTANQRGGGVSAPPYFPQHSGSCIVAGNAWNLHNDLTSAHEIFGELPVIAVNGAAREVQAFALYTMHPERFPEWARWQRKIHDGFKTHTSNREGNTADYIWPSRGGGGSAWGARKVASFMGFDKVVLCGCPLEIGGYTGYRPGGFMTRQNIVDDLRHGIEQEPEWHEGCISMSGWTRELLC